MSDPEPSVLAQVIWVNWSFTEVQLGAADNVVRVQLSLLPGQIHYPLLNGTWMAYEAVKRWSGLSLEIMRRNTDAAIVTQIDAAVSASDAANVARIGRALIDGRPQVLMVARAPLQCETAMALISAWNQARYRMSDRSIPDAYGRIGWIQDALAKLGTYLPTDVAELMEFAKKHGIHRDQVNWAAPAPPLVPGGGPQAQLTALLTQMEVDLLRERSAFEALSDAIAKDPYIVNGMNNQGIETLELKNALRNTSRRMGAVTHNVY